jgi:molybdate transport system substrate-binding protein
MVACDQNRQHQSRLIPHADRQKSFMNTPHQLHLLSGGAAQGLVAQLQAGFKAQHLCSISGTFSAVGVMKAALLAGAPCDVIVLTENLIAELMASGQLLAGSSAKVGVVKTGVAVNSGANPVDVSTAEKLKAALLAAKGIYFPDPIKATAGIHVMKVLKALGLESQLAGKLHTYANGATAMKAMADAGSSGLIGCTQITEIVYTPGVELVAPLPVEFELATTYTAAIAASSTQGNSAAALIELMCSDGTAKLRLTCGFED